MCTNCDKLMCCQSRLAHVEFKLFQSHNIIDVISGERKSFDVSSCSMQQIPMLYKARNQSKTYSEQLFCSKWQVTFCSQCIICIRYKTINNPAPKQQKTSDNMDKYWVNATKTEIYRYTGKLDKIKAMFKKKY